MKQIIFIVFTLFLFACENINTKFEIKDIIPELSSEELIQKYTWRVLSSTPTDIANFSKDDDIYFHDEKLVIISPNQ